MRSTLAVFCTGALFLSAILPTLSFAQRPTSFEDVPEDAWYADAVESLLESGALDPSERFLRPQERATRAEMAKLLVRVSGGTLLYPATPSFDDVPKNAWYFPFIEASAKAGWIRGDQDCYNDKKHPCTARPSDGVNRAEAAALLARAFALTYLNEAPVFSDNDRSEWYFISIQTAADYCILQGDGLRGTVRPGAFMNRAEMIAMFHRASQDMLYGQDCGKLPPELQPKISSIAPAATTRLRVTFTEEVRANVADNADQYVITSINGRQTVAVDSVTVVSGRTVELKLKDELETEVTYTLTARDMEGEENNPFTDSMTFSIEAAETGHLIDIETMSSTRIRLTFDSDIDKSRIEEEERFRVTGPEGPIDIGLAIQRDARTVELTLTEPLELQESYIVETVGLETIGGTVFSDEETIIYGETQSVSFRATLRGSSEVPVVTTLATGTGTFTLTNAGLQYDISVAGLSGSLVGAHFHRGAVGVSGAVVEPITFNGNRATGTWADLTASERHDLLKGMLCVNVHSQEHPDGEIRGQVTKQ